MNILILSFYYTPDLCAGSFRTASLIQAFKQQLSTNDKITILTTFPNRYNSYETEIPSEHEKDGSIEVIRIKIPAHKNGLKDQIKSFFVYFKEALKISREIKTDLVFATSSRLFTAYLGARIARKKDKPLYLDIRDIFVDTMHSISKPIYYLLNPFLSIIEKYTFSTPINVNLVSKGFETYFRMKYPNLNYTFHTNGIDEEFINNSFKKFSQKKKGKIKILYAGNIGIGQGLHRIVTDFANNIDENYIIEIIGDGSAKELLLSSLNSKNKKNVTILPPLSRKLLIEKYKQADILFLHLNDVPAFKKVLPSKLFEYAATGKPILAGVSGYCKDFIESEIDNAAVFYPCNNSGAVSALSRLELIFTKREAFILKYRRKNIMMSMALDIISSINN